MSTVLTLERLVSTKSSYLTEMLAQLKLIDDFFFVVVFLTKRSFCFSNCIRFMQHYNVLNDLLLPYKSPSVHAI